MLMSCKEKQKKPTYHVAVVHSMTVGKLNVELKFIS